MVFLAPLLLSAALLAAPPIEASGGVRLCVEDETDLPVVARIELQAELRAVLGRLDVEFLEGPCPAPTSDAVRLRLQSRPNGTPASALGAARVDGERIAPDLAVFPEAIRAFTAANDCRRLGRAIGRVAAHELAHYLLQSLEHESDGLLREAFPPQQLGAPAARAAFRLSWDGRRPTD